MRQASEARSRPRAGRAPASGATAVSAGGSLARPFVSIVVPCRNEAGYIEQMLDSMLANEYPRDRLEVLIVDGMSDDGTREVIAQYARRHPEIQLIDNPKRTTPRALNLGISRARGRIIMRMDVHAAYPPNYIADLVDCLERTGADSVGASWRTQPGDATVMAGAIAAALGHPFSIGNAHYRMGAEQLREVNTVQCGCYRRDVFDRLGMFDEDLLRSQDSEFTFRVLKAGGRVLLEPKVVALYYTRAGLGKLWRMFLQYGYFKPLVARKVGAVMTGRQVVPAVFLTTVGLAALFAPWFGLARGLLVLTMGAYVAADLVVAAMVARRRGMRIGIASSVVFPAIHLAFGAGYLRGTWDFLIRKRRGAPMVPLTR